VRKSEEREHKLLVIEEECQRIPPTGWAEMIRKVYEKGSPGHHSRKPNLILLD